MTNEATKIIVGVVVGVAGFSALLIALFCLLRSKRNRLRHAKAIELKNTSVRSTALTANGDIVRNGLEPRPWVAVEGSKVFLTDVTNLYRLTDSNHNYEARTEKVPVVEATTVVLTSSGIEDITWVRSVTCCHDDLPPNGVARMSSSLCEEIPSGGSLRNANHGGDSVWVGSRTSVSSSSLLNDHTNDNFCREKLHLNQDGNKDESYARANERKSLENAAFEAEDERIGQNNLASTQSDPLSAQGTANSWHVAVHVNFPVVQVDDSRKDCAFSAQNSDSADTTDTESSDNASSRASSPSVQVDDGISTTEDDDTFADLPMDFRTEVLITLGEDWNKLFPERQCSLQYRTHRRNKNRKAYASDLSRKTFTL